MSSQTSPEPKRSNTVSPTLPAASSVGFVFQPLKQIFTQPHVLGIILISHRGSSQGGRRPCEKIPTKQCNEYQYRALNQREPRTQRDREALQETLDFSSRTLGSTKNISVHNIVHNIDLQPLNRERHRETEPNPSASTWLRLQSTQVDVSQSFIPRKLLRKDKFINKQKHNPLQAAENNLLTGANGCYLNNS